MTEKQKKQIRRGPDPSKAPKHTRTETSTRKPKTPRTLAKLHASTLTSAFNYLEPNWRAYIDYVRMSAEEGDKDMQRFVQIWMTLTAREKFAITPEQLCERANVQVEDLVGEVCRMLWKVQNFAAGIITALAHPKVIKKTVQEAMKKDGGVDRSNFLKGTGFLPTPKPAIMNPHYHLPAGTPPPEAQMLPSHSEEIGLLDAMDAEMVEPPE